MMGLQREPRRVEGTPALRVELERNPEAPSVARAAIAGFFVERELDPGTLATLTLLVSELVSNAVAHSDAPPSSAVVLCVRLLGAEGVRVEVTDGGSGFVPEVRDPNQQGGGYGLYLIDKQAKRWDVRQEDGTCVWFEMSSRSG